MAKLKFNVIGVKDKKPRPKNRGFLLHIQNYKRTIALVFQRVHSYARKISTNIRHRFHSFKMSVTQKVLTNGYYQKARKRYRASSLYPRLQKLKGRIKKFLLPFSYRLDALFAARYGKIAVVVIISATIIGSGILVFSINREDPNAYLKDEIITFTTDAPDETPPGKGYKWYGYPDDPKYLRIPSIQTEGYFQKVGVDQFTNVASPNNIHMAGWFVNTKRPGEQGLSVIDGHVGGWSKLGIFKSIDSLKEGDIIEITMGNDYVHRYSVMTVMVVDTAESVSYLFSQNPQVKGQLNMITCGGNYDQQNKTYLQRVIVTAGLMN